MREPFSDKQDYLDHVARPIVGQKVEFASTGEGDVHAHRKDQLLYVIEGLITVEVGQGVWTVPPRCAIWIPAGIEHSARPVGRVSIGNLYIEKDVSREGLLDCGILFVQPLLRELVLRFVNDTQSHTPGDEREMRLAAVLRDELEMAPLEPLRLPIPSDPRLKRLVDTLMAEPSIRLSLEEWGARVGASHRTLTRLFQRDTGMSFGQWRQQWHVSLALQRLSVGESVTNIAVDLGYESVSAFIAMFRRMLGTTPARYLSAAFAEPRNQP